MHRVFGTLLAVAMLAACSGMKSVERRVAERFIDPSSVQFQEVTRYKENVCGQVNAKNAYGAYTGFVLFIATDTSVIISTPEHPVSSDQFLRECMPWDAAAQKTLDSMLAPRP